MPTRLNPVQYRSLLGKARWRSAPSGLNDNSNRRFVELYAVIAAAARAGDLGYPGGYRAAKPLADSNEFCMGCRTAPIADDGSVHGPTPLESSPSQLSRRAIVVPSGAQVVGAGWQFSGEEKGKLIPLLFHVNFQGRASTKAVHVSFALNGVERT